MDGRVEARLRLLATEKQVLVASVGSSNDGRAWDFVLLSEEDGFSYELPPLHAGFGFPRDSDCIFLNGKVYAFGGEKCDGLQGDEVYVMDLAEQGQRQWKRCRSMPFAKGLAKSFGFAVDGKIYMCSVENRYDDVIHVYDPASDAWDLLRTVPGATCSDMVPGLLDARKACLELEKQVQMRYEDL